MRPYSLDDYWELLKQYYERRNRPIPRRWKVFYRIVRVLLRWGAR